MYLLDLQDKISEWAIAFSVYEEQPNYDPTLNGKIRVAAAYLRERLEEYYAREGQNDPIEIKIPKGTYVPTVRERRPAIAVIAIENWNPDAARHAHLCAPIREEIVLRLMSTGSLRVSRVEALETLDHQFHYGLRGSLECRADILRLNASLIDLHSREIICCHGFECRRDDILKLCRQVAEAVLARVSPEGDHNSMGAIRAPRARFECHQLYQKGRWHLRRRTAGDIKRAIDYFEQALEANSEYAPAYSGLADSHLLLSWYELTTPDRVWFESAKSYALTALKLNALLPEVRTSLAYALLLCDFDWAAAETEFRQSILFENHYAPAHHWYSNLLVMQGRFSEAEAEMNRAFHLDSGSIVIRKTMGDPYYYSRRYEEAIKRYSAALKTDPNFWMAHLFLGWAYQQEGATTRALHEFEAVTAHTGISSIAQGAIGHLYATSGEESKALSIINYLKEQPETPHVAPHTLAVIYAGLGENDRAFECLDASYANRIELLAWIKVDPRFEVLHADPRFDRFLERVGLKTPPADASL
jgi:tetratricopeptide (TPR) repeat protein